MTDNSATVPWTIIFKILQASHFCFCKNILLNISHQASPSVKSTCLFSSLASSDASCSLITCSREHGITSTLLPQGEVTGVDFCDQALVGEMGLSVIVPSIVEVKISFMFLQKQIYFV